MNRTPFMGSHQASVLDAYYKWWPLTFSQESLAWGTLWRLKGNEKPRQVHMQSDHTGLRGRALRGPIKAKGGVIAMVDRQLVFILEERLLVELIEVFGPDVPAAIPAEPLVCMADLSDDPPYGTFYDPETETWCSPKALIPESNQAVPDGYPYEPICALHGKVGRTSMRGTQPPPPGVCCQMTSSGGVICSTGVWYASAT